MAIFCGVIIFFPNKFVKASQLKKEPVDYSVIKSATEEEMNPKTFAAINKAAEKYILKMSQPTEPTLMEYKGITYIIYDYYGGIKAYIFPSLKLDSNASIININNYYKDYTFFLLNEDGIYLFYGNEFMHIKDSYREGFSIISDTKDPIIIFKDKKRTYQFTSPNNLSAIKLYGPLKAHDDDDSITTPTYYTDKKHVYYVDRDVMDVNIGLAIIPGADPKTFQLGANPKTFGQFADEFYRDKRYLYTGMYSGIKRVKKADPNTARMLEIFIGKVGRFSKSVLIDKKHLFFYKGYSNLVEILGLNISKVETITTGKNSEFLVNAFLDKKHGKVYSVDFDSKKAVEIPGADPLSFKVSTFDSGNAYFHDKSSVYVPTSSLLLVAVPSADIETFEFVCHNASYGRTVYKDKDNVYYVGKNDVAALNDADAKSFKVFDQDYCASAADKNHVFEYDIEKSKYVIRNDLDAATFQSVNRNGLPYRYDKNGFYFYKFDNNGEIIEEVIKGPDIKTFKEIAGKDGTYDFLYLYDNSGVWFLSEKSFGGELKKIEGADPKTFDFTKPPPDL